MLPWRELHVVEILVRASRCTCGFPCGARGYAPACRQRINLRLMARFLQPPVIKRFAKPVLLYGSIIVATELVLFLRQETLNSTVAIAVFAATAIFCCAIVWLSMRAVKAYINGFETGGIGFEVIEDEIGCWGEHRMRLKTSEGVHRVESVIGSTLHIRYRGPFSFGWQRIPLYRARRAGREEAQRLASAKRRTKRAIL